MKGTILTTAAIAAVLFIGASAQATNNTFDNVSGNDWNTPANWSEGHVPTYSENAVIPSEETCNVNIATAVADTIQVSGTLNIEPDQKLTLDGSTSSTSYVDGTLNLEASGTPAYGTLAFTTGNHTLAATDPDLPGSIVGANHGCRITLDTTDQVLTSDVTISGALKITESVARTGTRFVNDDDGTVHANVADTLEIDLDSFGGAGLFQVSLYSGAELLLSTDSSSLTGDFSLSTGKLTIGDGVQVSTEGDLTLFTSGARIIVGDSGAYMAFNQ